VLRSGWERDAIWALFDGGPFGYAHQHEDKLNLLLHAYGRLLLTEGGNYAYDMSEMRRYVLSTRAHNTIRVDGLDQNRRLNFRSQVSADQPGTLQNPLTTPSGAAWSFTQQLDTAEATYNEGYGPYAKHIVSHHRRVIFFKQSPDPLLGPLLLVIDSLSPSDDAEHQYEALWHLDAGQAEIDGLVTTTSDVNMANLTIIAAPLPALALTLVTGQEAPEWQGWKSIKDNQQGEYVPTPTAVYSWAATGPSQLITLLYPTRPGENCPVVALEAGPDGAGVRLRLRDGRVVLMMDDGR
jgi:hypothetical protein